jgi:hypothetical protein
MAASFRKFLKRKEKMLNEAENFNFQLSGWGKIVGNGENQKLAMNILKKEFYAFQQEVKNSGKSEAEFLQTGKPKTALGVIKQNITKNGSFRADDPLFKKIAIAISIVDHMASLKSEKEMTLLSGKKTYPIKPKEAKELMSQLTGTIDQKGKRKISGKEKPSFNYIPIVKQAIKISDDEIKTTKVEKKENSPEIKKEIEKADIEKEVEDEKEREKIPTSAKKEMKKVDSEKEEPEVEEMPSEMAGFTITPKGKNPQEVADEIANMKEIALKAINKISLTPEDKRRAKEKLSIIDYYINTAEKAHNVVMNRYKSEKQKRAAITNARSAYRSALTIARKWIGRAEIGKGAGVIAKTSGKLKEFLANITKKAKEIIDDPRTKKIADTIARTTAKIKDVTQQKAEKLIARAEQKGIADKAAIIQNKIGKNAADKFMKIFMDAENAGQQDGFQKAVNIPEWQKAAKIELARLVTKYKVDLRKKGVKEQLITVKANTYKNQMAKKLFLKEIPQDIKKAMTTEKIPIEKFVSRKETNKKILDKEERKVV